MEFLGPEMEKVMKYCKQIKSRAYILRVKKWIRGDHRRDEKDPSRT